MPLQKVVLYITALLLLLPGQVLAEDIVILQSSNLKPYEQARRGFENEWGKIRPTAGPKSISQGNLSHIILADQSGNLPISQLREVRQADILVVIGGPALKSVSRIQDIPIIFLLVPEAEDIVGGRKNITGVDMKNQPSRQLAAIAKALPNSYTIGALYNPQQTGPWVVEAMTTGNSLHTLVFHKINRQTDFPQTLMRLRGKIDAYWMLPDRLVASPQTFKHLLKFSVSNKVPIVTFSERFLKMGAGLAISFDLADMGAQGADIAKRIAQGAPIQKMAHEPPRKLKVVANPRVLKKLGVSFNPDGVTGLYNGEDVK